MAYFRTPELNPDKKLHAYIIGLALGDGNLSRPGPRAVRLRISCDNKYPLLIGRIVEALRLLLPNNKVGLVKRKRNCTDVSVYSNHLEKLLGWRADNGPKFAQKVTVPKWIKNGTEFKINCLKGLIETDGSIYTDRGYKMMLFTSNIPKLANDVYEMIVSLGFNPHLYIIKAKKGRHNYNRQPFYHIRLSKKVSDFLELVKPDKS